MYFTFIYVRLQNNYLKLLHRQGVSPCIMLKIAHTLYRPVFFLCVTVPVGQYYLQRHQTCWYYFKSLDACPDSCQSPSKFQLYLLSFSQCLLSLSLSFSFVVQSHSGLSQFLLFSFSNLSERNSER